MVQRKPNETEDDFERRRNTFYGRRLVEKEKRRNLQLQQQRRELQLANEELKRENRRLEGLIVQTRIIVGTVVGGNAFDEPQVWGTV